MKALVYFLEEIWLEHAPGKHCHYPIYRVRKQCLEEVEKLLFGA